MPKPAIVSSSSSFGAAVNHTQSSLLEGMIDAIERLDGPTRLVDVQTFQGLQRGPEEDDYDNVVLVRILQTDGFEYPAVVAVAMFASPGVSIECHDPDLLAALREAVELTAATSPDIEVAVIDQHEMHRIKHRKENEA